MTVKYRGAIFYNTNIHQIDPRHTSTENQKDNFCVLQQFNTIETTWYLRNEWRPEAAEILDPTEETLESNKHIAN